MSLKIEINSREHISVYEREIRLFKMESQWFSRECGIVTYSFNELIGTKLRALYQRKKGRDLFDIYAALKSGKLDVSAVIDCFRKYMAFQSIHVPTRTEYTRNLENKMADHEFRRDLLPFLAQGVEYDIDKAFKTVNEQIVELL